MIGSNVTLFKGENATLSLLTPKRWYFVYTHHTKYSVVFLEIWSTSCLIVVKRNYNKTYKHCQDPGSKWVQCKATCITESKAVKSKWRKIALNYKRMHDLIEIQPSFCTVFPRPRTRLFSRRFISGQNNLALHVF